MPVLRLARSTTGALKDREGSVRREEGRVEGERFEEERVEVFGIKVLEESGEKEKKAGKKVLVKPRYDSTRNQRAWDEDLHALILLVATLMIGVLAGISRDPLLATTIILGAVMLMLVQPMLGYDRWPTGYRLAELLYERGLLLEWACYSNSVPFIANLNNGVHVMLILRWLGIKARLVATSSAGHVTLVPTMSRKTKVEIRKLRTLKTIKWSELDGRESYKDVRIKAGLYIVELTAPSVRRENVGTFYKGKAAIVDITSMFTVKPTPLDNTLMSIILRVATNILYEPVGSPSRARLKAFERRTKLWMRPLEAVRKSRAIRTGGKVERLKRRRKERPCRVVERAPREKDGVPRACML
uniref:Uncharacterized protein n=1 Tax=Fervidicoccus fontis TaxID=683846 RepID=A0A7J3ZJT8_9CREN